MNVKCDYPFNVKIRSNSNGILIKELVDAFS